MSQFDERQDIFEIPVYEPINDKVAEPVRPSIRIHVLLFVLTFLSTLFIGMMHAGVKLTQISDLLKGLPYAVSLMSILVVHESGHFFASRRWGVDSTLPYFIPAPFMLLGTFGAIIKMKSPIPNRRALIDIGALGPLCGLVVAVAVSVVGLTLSTVVDQSFITERGSYFYLGDSLLFKFLGYLVVGNLPEGKDLMLHPVAFAGWIGIFITAMNLLPIGQFDGGHVFFGLTRKGYYHLRYIVILFLAIFGVMYWSGWLFIALLGSLFGLRHPAPLDPYTPLDHPRRILGLVTFIIFILCFVPVPIQVR